MNTDTASKKKRAYRSSLREGQAQETRALILKAVGETLAASGPEGLSALEVARRAGVTARTLYRHFGSREGLLAALRAYATREALPRLPESREALLAFPQALFGLFDQHAPWVEALLQAGPGASAREAGKPNRNAHFQALMDHLLPHRPLEERLASGAIVKLLLSVDAWKTLRDDFSLQGAAAQRAVRWALEQLIPPPGLQQGPQQGPRKPESSSTAPQAGADEPTRTFTQRKDPAMLECSPLDLIGLAAATTAALDAGLLKAVLEGPPRTALELASGLKLDPRATERVLAPLVATGLVQQTADHYGPSPQLSGLGSLTTAGFDFNRLLWAHTSEYLRSGRPLLEMDGSTQTRAAQYAGAVGGLATLFEGVAGELAEALPLTPSSVLDVGCGSGVWSLALAQRFPHAQVIGLDLPGVLEVFRARAHALGLDERTRTLEGGMFEVPLPAEQVDLAILANVLRLEPPERARALLARIAGAVKPGGAVLVVDALAEGTPARAVARSVYALHLSLRTRQGQVHSPEALRTWLQEAGCTGLEPIPLRLTPGAVGAILGRKS